jgi:membrane-associated protein
MTQMLAFSLAPQDLITTVGLAGIAAIVFAESGLLIGFFLPGDSLLFTAGAAAAGALKAIHVGFSYWALLAVVIVAAIVGDQVGYVIGHRAGPALFDRPDSRWFNHAHLDRSSVFFDHHGSKALVIARFIPIVRTFVPVVAGASRMDYRKFVTFNVIGGTLWAAGVTTAGFWFGRIPLIRDHLEIAILSLVALSLIPIAIEILRARREPTSPAVDR